MLGVPDGYLVTLILTTDAVYETPDPRGSKRMAGINSNLARGSPRLGYGRDPICGRRKAGRPGAECVPFKHSPPVADANSGVGRSLVGNVRQHD